MSRRNDKTWSVALCLSLLLHGGVMVTCARIYTHELQALLSMPALPRGTVAQEDTIYQRSPFDLGDTHGKGYAVNASPGDESMQAPEGPDQAWLSRDPAGFGDPSEPAQSVLPEGQGGSNGGGGATEVLPPATHQPAPFGVAGLAGSMPPPPHRKIPLPASAIAIGANMPEMPQPPVEPAKPQSPEEGNVAVASAPGAPGRPGIPAASADPAPQSDMDSDAFSSIASAQFRPGRVDVKFGRKFKITRPRLLLAGSEALLSLRFPSLVLKINISPEGNVTSVEVVRSSGSNDIDQPCQLAAYNWWFEPKRDASGQAVADVILFTIQWR